MSAIDGLSVVWTSIRAARFSGSWSVPRQRTACSDLAAIIRSRRAKCHSVGFHGLRHTFASHFMMSGGNILTLQKLLGYSSVAVTMKYAHLAPDFMRDEVCRLRFDRKTAGTSALREGVAA